MITAVLIVTLAGFGFTNDNAIVNKPFDINDYAWLAGSWTGDGFGGISHEIWSLPEEGTMMGMYRYIKEGKLVFYEFMLLDETGMKIKHFNADMSSWEEKEKFINFEMIEYSANKIVLKGLTFERKSDSELEIRLKMRYGDEVKTEVFNMKRMK